MCGITPQHIYQLTVGAFDGGRALDLRSIGDMTPDQIWFLLHKREDHRGPRDSVREMSWIEAAELTPIDGKYKGRSATGEVIQAPIIGTSLVQRIRERKQKEREAQMIEQEQRDKEESRRKRRAERIQRRREQR